MKHAKELQMRSAERAPKGSTGMIFFSKFSSLEQSHAAALRQDKIHQRPQATHPVQQYLPQKEVQETGLSAQAQSSSNNDTVAIVVHQTMIELSKAESEEE
jgi:hypothetical protein